MASDPTNVLPEEVMQLVFDHLEPRDFCCFCRVSKAVHEDYQYNSHYWRNAVVRNFRLPVSPLLRADGGRWYWLYKKLKTQSRVYTWGQGLKGNLGRGRGARVPRRLGRADRTYDRTTCPWPTEAHVPEEVGIVADLQCGGYSTSLLTSDGKLYMVGIVDAADGRYIGTKVENFTRLEYLSQSTAGIRSFSAGRRHILALDDNNEILSWDRINAKGYKVYTRTSQRGAGKARTVVAGWTHSSAYIPDTGIVCWPFVVNSNPDPLLDAVHINELVIPGTSRRRDATSARKRYEEVLKHIVLEGCVVWIFGFAKTPGTTKLFAAPIRNDRNPSGSQDGVVEVPGYAGHDLVDIQGSFRNFAVFTANGEVLAGNTDYLNRCFAMADSLSPSTTTSNDTSPTEAIASLIVTRPPDIPALQHKGVIGLSFGDYHSLALHSNGILTAYGKDPGGEGAPGLGQAGKEGALRGLAKTAEVNHDYELLPVANTTGREIWLEPEKRNWLYWMIDGLSDDQRREIARDRNKQAVLSEWVEREGRKWEEGPSPEPPGSSQDGARLDYDNLGAYFAISVAAAGWHSAALVLVNDEKAEAIRQKWLVRSHVRDDDKEEEKRMPGHFDLTPDEHDEYVWELQAFDLHEVVT